MSKKKHFSIINNPNILNKMETLSSGIFFYSKINDAE